MMWEMVARKRPYAGMVQLTILSLVSNGQRESIPDDAPYADLIARCWHQDPSKRPEAKEVEQEATMLEQQLRDAETTTTTAGGKTTTSRPMPRPPTSNIRSQATPPLVPPPAVGTGAAAPTRTTAGRAPITQESWRAAK